MADTAQSGVTLREVLRVLRKWQGLIVVAVAVAVATSGVLSFLVLPKKYQATATVDVTNALATNVQQIPPQISAQQATDLQGVVNAIASLPVSTLQTYQWELTSPVVLSAAAKDLARHGVPLTAVQLTRVVKATNVQGTNLLTIAATDHDPATAALIANEVARAFLAFEQSKARAQLANALALLQNQQQSIKSQLAAETAALAKAESAPGASSATQSQLNSDLQQLSTLQQQYAQAHVQAAAALAGADALQQQLNRTPKMITTVSQNSTGAKGSTTSVQPNPTYQALEQQLATQRQAQAAADATVSELDTQIRALEAQVQALQAQATAAQAAITPLQARVAQLTSAYETLTSKITQVQVANATTTNSGAVYIDALATTPTVPVSPKKKLNVALAFVLGLLVSVALAFGLEQLDNTIKSPEDLARFTDIPTLAVIPHIGD